MNLLLHGMTLTPYMQLASVNFFVLLGGFSLRKKASRIHAALMSLGMLSDLALVTLLSIQRSAVATALEFKLSLWKQAHIFSSTGAALLYAPMAALGLLLLWGGIPAGGRRNKIIEKHRNLGYLTLFFRTLGFFLMFSMLKVKP